ncbi:MAG TPA: antibiotic biosynthesis monooxygenase [Candidatus Binataceae bacterium]|jgi:heme-degrading monooxygenase HmoA|nr:antibiotic biosynthesis monooxygenase [Candidatus Binataceae bacterium]
MTQEKQPRGRVMVVFRFRMREDLTAAEREEYNATAQRLMELTSGMPGFVSIREWHNKGETLGITEWASLEALAAWRDHPEHRKAQERGRELFYAEYDVSICQPLHQYSFKRAQ